MSAPSLPSTGGDRAASPERLARVALATVAEPGHPRLSALASSLGAPELLRALLEQATRDRLGRDLAARLRTVEPVAELDRADRLGVRFVVPGDDEWPPRLDDLAHAPLLHERGGVPLGLWVRGSVPLADAVAGTPGAVAVVGSRSATTYGADVAAEIAATVSGQGLCVVSGAAFGIDQAAHRGALAARGVTVAVLACGVDRPYPRAHAELLDYVAEHGCVVSETPLGGAPMRVRFLARNRIIAALGAGTVVVEAAIRSGALNTASWSAGLGRVVMGVPGPVGSAQSEGVHQLIRSRDALLVTRGAEVLEAVSPAGSALLDEPRDEATARDRLDSEDRQLLDAVPLRRAVGLDRIARTAGLDPGRVPEAMDRLRRAGLVEHAGQRWRLVADAPGATPGG